MARWVFAVIALILLTHEAAAQPPADHPAPESAEKSVVSAYLLTVAATTAPLAIASLAGERDDRSAAIFGSIGIAGMVLGPSAGHWYAGDYLTTGLVLRAAGVAFVAGLAIHDPHLEQPTTVMGLLVGAAAWETGIIWDLVTVPRAVRRHNQRRHLQLVPTPRGLAVAGRF